MNSLKDIEKMVDNFFNSLPCQSKIPFPETEVEKPDKQYAELLYNAYSSSGNSELQAVTQYIYHHQTISNENVANILLCIALVEMRHLDALATLIEKLGGKPAYYNGNKSWFMTGDLGYVDNVQDCSGNKNKNDLVCQKVTTDLLGEKAAIKNYKALITEIKDKKIIKVIEKIISDEEVHVNILREVLNDLGCKH